MKIIHCPLNSVQPVDAFLELSWNQLIIFLVPILICLMLVCQRVRHRMVQYKKWSSTIEEFLRQTFALLCSLFLISSFPWHSLNTCDDSSESEAIPAGSKFTSVHLRYVSLWYGAHTMSKACIARRPAILMVPCVNLFAIVWCRLLMNLNWKRIRFYVKALDSALRSTKLFKSKKKAQCHWWLRTRSLSRLMKRALNCKLKDNFIKREP